MDRNKEVYNIKQVVEWYSHLHELIPVEKKVFERYRNILQEGKVLDIGIGGGRTTSYLHTICKEYIGIDYSESFIQLIKEIYPGVESFVMDARNLSAFEDKSFDFVNFSFNGIDYVEEEGRQEIFFEISRVLKKEGLFFFSTHNRNHRSFNTAPWSNQNNSLFTNIKTFVKLLPFLANKIRNQKNTHIKKKYAIINDSAHNYNLMTFYTSPEFLREQLNDSGFSEIRFFTRTGEEKSDEELEDWIFVTAKKSALK